jgi:glycosyltransferase involved in cell wall biosynthesis
VHRALLRERIDALNIQYQSGAYRMHPAVNFLPLYLKLRGNPARVVVTFHDLLLPYLFPKAGPLRRLANWLLLKFSDAAIVTNAEDAAATAGWGDKVRVVPIGSNIAVAPSDDHSRDMWRQEQSIAANDMLVAYFGLQNQSKGLDTLLHALTKLPSRFKLAIVGGGTGESDPTNRHFAAQIGAVIERLGLGGRIFRSGQISAREVSAWLCGADIAALPFRDGATLRRGSLLATLTHGLPTVSTLTPAQQPGWVKSRLITFNPEHPVGVVINPEHPVGVVINPKPPARVVINSKPPAGVVINPKPQAGVVINPKPPAGVWGRIVKHTYAHRKQSERDQPHQASDLPELKDGENLLLVPPDDADALAAAIARLAGDQALRARLSAGARELATQVGWERIAEQVRAVMRG